MKRIFASLSLLITLVAGSLAFGAGTAAAADSASCVSARTALASVTLDLGKAQEAYDDRGSVTEEAAKALLDTVNRLKVTVDEKQRTVNSECRDGRGNGGWNGHDNDRFRSCADYARDGIYNINRGDRRYRDALDVDDDGVACERNGDDNDDRWDRNRGCRELTDARDEARKQIQEANEKITEVVAASSDEGAKVTDSEALARDEQIRQAHDAIKKFNEEVEDSNRRCNDADDDLGATLLPIPGDNGGDNTTINLPPASSGGSNNDDGNVSSGNTPKGGIETGNGVETDPTVLPLVLIAGALSLAVAGAWIVALVRSEPVRKV